MILAKVIVLIVMILLDALWIGYFANDMYHKNFKAIQKHDMKTDVVAAALAYLFVALAIFFIAIPLVEHHSRQRSRDILLMSLLVGGFVGFAVYGIFNLTCKAIFANYSWKVVVIDTSWGTFLFAFLCSLYYFILQKIKR